MTKIDFYNLPEDGSDKRLPFSCRLVEKIHALGHRVFVHAASREQAEDIDRMLWTRNQESFVPHALCGSDLADRSPVLIGHDADPPEPCDVLVNLTLEVPVFFSRFQRVAEIVDGDAAARERSRANYRFYKERGYPLDVHRV